MSQTSIWHPHNEEIIYCSTNNLGDLEILSVVAVPSHSEAYSIVGRHGIRLEYEVNLSLFGRLDSKSRWCFLKFHFDREKVAVYVRAAPDSLLLILLFASLSKFNV